MAEEGEVPFEAFTGAPARGAPKTIPAGSPKTEMASFEDFAEGPQVKGADTFGKGIATLKGLGGESAALADMVLSLPAMALGTGANLGMQIQARARGESPKIAAMAGREAGDEANKYLGNPLQKVLALFKSDEIYNEAKTTKGMEKVAAWIQEAGEWVEHQSNGRIPAEQVQTLADVLMLGAGTRGIDTAAKLYKQQRVMPKATEPREIGAAEMTERGPTYTAQQQIKESLGIKDEAEQKAWNEKRKKDVREAFKKDPDYASYLASLAEERVRNHDNWTGKEQARERAEQYAEHVGVKMGILDERAAGRQGRAAYKAREIDDQLGSKEVSMGEAMEILQKPAEERTGQELLAVRRWNRQAGAVKPEHAAMLAAAGIGAVGGLWLDPEQRLESGLIGAMAGLAPTLLMTGRGSISARREAGAVRGPGLRTTEEVLPLLEKDETLWAHFTKRSSVSGIQKEGLQPRGKGGINTEEWGVGRDFEPDGISLTRDKEVLNAYTKPEGGVREDFAGGHEVLLARATPKNVLDLTKHEVGIRELHKKMGWELDPENLPDFLTEKEVATLERGGEVKFPAHEHNMLAMLDVLGPLKEHGDALGKEIREKLQTKGYDAVLYPDELRVLDAKALKVERASEEVSDTDVLRRTRALHRESKGVFAEVSIKDLQDYKAGKLAEDSPQVRAIEQAVAPRADWQSLQRGSQKGEINLKTAARLGAVAAGAVAGAALADDQATGAIIGALGALGLSAVNPRTVAGVAKKAFAADDRLRVNTLANTHEYRVAAAARAIWQMQGGIEKQVPKLERREAITRFLEGDDSIKLNATEAAVAQIARNYFDEMAKTGQDAGVLKDAVNNYVTHLWEHGGQTKGKIQEVFEKRGGPNMSPETRFAMKRQIPTIAEGKALGLRPQSEDISTIIGVYGNAVQRALANKQLLTALKHEKSPEGAALLQPSAKAPRDYVSVDHPQMAGLRVHPDIAPSLGFIFDNYRPGVILRGLEGVNTLTKRMAVSFSLFHAKALADAFIGAANNPFAVGKQVAQAAAPKFFGTNEYLRMLKEGGAGDLVDKAQRGGLKFSFERESPAVEDVRGTFYTAMKDLQTGLDNMIPGAGLPVKGFTKLNHAVDKFMWDRLHAGMKLSIFAEKYKTLLENNAAANAKDPMVPLRHTDQIAEMAADFTNSIFGGLNWRRVAESSATRWGREAALAAYSPTGRRVMQILLFAPDWTISTTRAAIQAFGKGTGVQGLFKPQNVADLHRQYLVRSAIYYLAVGDALNYSMSGHHLWDNKDPTTIDLGDGRRMQWSKHTMEPVHWLTKPGQQGLNKLGFVPREIANQALGTEYLSTSGHAPRMQNRATHMARQFLPISVQQSFDAGEGSGVAGFLGVPIYGKTEQERLKIKEQKRLKRALGEK